VYMYVCVCECVYECVCVCMYMCACVYMCEHVCECKCVCVHMCECVYECVYMSVCVYICMCAYVCVCVRVCICVGSMEFLLASTSLLSVSASHDYLMIFTLLILINRQTYVQKGKHTHAILSQLPNILAILFHRPVP